VVGDVGVGRGLPVSLIGERITQALEARGGTKHGDELRFRCVAHEDDRPSADFNVSKMETRR
jgi:hypothetical protein